MAEPTPTPTAVSTDANPMAPHVKAIAVIDLVFAGLTGLAALGAIFAFGVGSAAVEFSERYGTPEFVADMLVALAVVLGIAFLAVAALYLLAGLWLLSLRRSGKGLGMAAAVVQVIVGIPTLFGGGIGLLPLAAGIYGIVILTRPETDHLLVGP